MSPSVQLSDSGGNSAGLAAASAVILNPLVGAALLLKSNEAATNLLLIDNRSGVQIAAANGFSKNYDLGGFIGSGGKTFGGLGAYSKTHEGKVVIAAFVDSYNQMVQSLRHYKAQQVPGGLGTGGKLKVE